MDSCDSVFHARVLTMCRDKICVDDVEEILGWIDLRWSWEADIREVLESCVCRTGIAEGTPS